MGHSLNTKELGSVLPSIFGKRKLDLIIKGHLNNAFMGLCNISNRPATKDLR